MSLYVLAAIAVGLAMDTFAVAVGTSVALRRASRQQVFRFAFHFGLFQAVMPVIGWSAGRFVAGFIQAWDHWVAFGLLAFVGSKALYEALRGDSDKATTASERSVRLSKTARSASDPTRGWNLVLLSVATSVDALAVGLSFAMLQVAIWFPCLIIGLTTAALTTAGMIFGPYLGARIGKRVEVVGGLILIGIGLKILIQHLLESAG